MIGRELPPPPTLNADEIPHRTERTFFAYLQRTLPQGSIIAYEKIVLIENAPKGHRRKKVYPDFYVKTPNGYQFFIEVTKSKRGCRKDPKKRQKSIARRAQTGMDVIIYYGEDLKKIQAKYPDLVFFDSPEESMPKSGLIFSAVTNNA